MKKILFVCSAGMSTSLLVQKTQAVVDQKGDSMEITALAEAAAKSQYDTCDLILLGPQVRFLLKNIQKEVEGKGIPVEVIDTLSYGRMDGEAVYNQIKKALNE